MLSGQQTSIVKKTKIRSIKTEYLFLLPAVVFLLFFMIYPIVYNLLLSFKNVTLMNLVGIQEFVGLSNYKTVLKDPTFALSIKNSLIFTILSIVFQFTIGLALALYFNRKFPGRGIMRALVLVTWMLPIVVVGAIFNWLFAGDYGLINYFLQTVGIIDSPIPWLASSSTALYVVIIANIWIGIPFNMIILLGGLQGIPEELYEAARIDGANSIQRFFSVTIPLLKPTIMILLMLGIIYTFKTFDVIIVMTKGGPNNSTSLMPFYAYQLAFERSQFSLGAVVSTIMFGILLVISLFYLKSIGKEESL
ncbi:sugar ABC transporter permease [Metabacillus sp. BG109]|uniref:Sugar ABC transporter permease n=2 Tax=Metabacillus bambusae TaxID=2795218 RepID=A0ABS3N7X2_9BACI|nr:sugar ABC transporter permease [Metabacillus bambusae]